MTMFNAEAGGVHGQFGGRLRSMAAQVGDPDRGVDENHGRLGSR